MKKIILLLLLALVSVTASARKSYITVWTPYASGIAPVESSYDRIILTGDVPDNLEGFTYSPNAHYWENKRYAIPRYSTGEILNLLSEYGYEVEFVDNDNQSFLLSKEIPSSQTQMKGDVNEDNSVNISDVNEVISLILGKLRDNPNLLEELGIEQPK